MAEPIEDDALAAVRAGVDSVLTFTNEDAESVAQQVWLKLKVTPGFEARAEKELRPAIRQIVEAVTLHLTTDGRVVPEFRSSLAESQFMQLRRGGTWHSSVDVLAELSKLFG